MFNIKFDLNQTSFTQYSIFHNLRFKFTIRRIFKELATQLTRSFLSLRYFNINIKKSYTLCNIFQNLTNLRLNICIEFQFDVDLFNHYFIYYL